MLAIIIVSPFHKKARLLVKGHLSTFKLLRKQIDPSADYVWFHAASLGEFEQGRPLMERFRKSHPEYKILLTFFSPSGYEVRKNYDGADVVCYLPLDTPGNVLSFFRLVTPKMAFFIKYEFWMNYIMACSYRHIPVYSVSSIFRPEKIFFRWYGKAYSKNTLKKITHFFVQDEESARLLSSIRIRQNVTIVGDTRFDRVIDICDAAKDLPLIEDFLKNNQGGTSFVCGSTWAPDEDFIIPYFNAHKDMKLILAPHVIDESHLRQIEQKLQRPFMRYTDLVEKTKEDSSFDASGVDCLIINCFGLLSSIYRYGNLAYVGGGFGVGIHNVPEAAVYSIPVLIGPNNGRFREAQDLLRLGGCFEVNDTNSFNETMDHLLTDAEALKTAGERAGKYIHGNSGASDAIFKALNL